MELLYNWSQIKLIEIIKNRSPGTLYLTSAPNTGVPIPLITKSIVTKKRQFHKAFLKPNFILIFNLNNLYKKQNKQEYKIKFSNSG